MHPALQVDGQGDLERNDDGDQDVGKGDDQAGAELRGPSYPVFVSSLDTSPAEAKRNPTPRTVVMYRGLAGSSSSFLRSKEMWTSRVLVGPNQFGSQTSSMIFSRPMTSPALAMRRWRRSNSRA